VDKFHDENTYVICLDGDTLAGMIAMRSNRPFSLDKKIPNLNDYLPKNRLICEMRLLSVEKEYRNGYVFRGLLGLVLEYGKSKGWNFAIISGTLRQQKLYKHLGFAPFGPVVGTGEALFQPMYLTLETIEENSNVLLKPPASGRPETLPVSFLPGPVDIASEVREAFDAVPVSHRAQSFLKEFQGTKNLLRQLTSARSVEILLGSGSLANDVIAGQLSLLEAPGLILSNGEFGERLIDHATRFGLQFTTVRQDWGKTFNWEQVRQTLHDSPNIRWLWVTHCETSTGVLHDLDTLKRLTHNAGVKLCLDCISSIGTVAVDLSDVYLASGVSGKGLGAFPGLSLVFYNHDLEPGTRPLPRYLDLGYWAAQEGIPFTHSSNLLAALQASLKRENWSNRFEAIEELASWLRGRLDELGYTVLAAAEVASPAVLTLVLPAAISSKLVGWRLQKAGYLVSYRSEYLLKRNWIQVCFMGQFQREQVDALLSILSTLGAHREEAFA
jgi:aspartate aminotransferase-like enzyme